MRYWLMIIMIFTNILGYSLQRDTSVCDTHPELPLYHDWGPECLNPVPYTLPGFFPVGAAVHYAGMTVRVTGYFWNITEQRYWYTVEDNTGAGWMTAPERITP